LRKWELIQWVAIFILGCMAALWFISQSIPSDYAPVTVEIIGTFIGFIVALSFAEIIKFKDSVIRGRELKNHFVKGMLDFLEFEANLENTKGFSKIPNEIWLTSISTGDLVLLDYPLRIAVSFFYDHAREFNDGFQHKLLNLPTRVKEADKLHTDYLLGVKSVLLRAAKAIVESYGSDKQKKSIEHE